MLHLSVSSYFSDNFEFNNFFHPRRQNRKSTTLIELSDLTRWSKYIKMCLSSSDRCHGWGWCYCELTLMVAVALTWGADREMWRFETYRTTWTNWTSQSRWTGHKQDVTSQQEAQVSLRLTGQEWLGQTNEPSSEVDICLTLVLNASDDGWALKLISDKSTPTQNPSVPRPAHTTTALLLWPAMCYTLLLDCLCNFFFGNFPKHFWPCATSSISKRLTHTQFKQYKNIKYIYIATSVLIKTVCLSILKCPEHTHIHI